MYERFSYAWNIFFKKRFGVIELLKKLTVKWKLTFTTGDK